MGYLISYTCTKATPIFESPQAESPVAEYGTANLKPGASFLGRAVENDYVWIGSGIGFVPRHAAAPSFTYVVAVHTPIYEDHRFDALIAEYGQAKFYAGYLCDQPRNHRGCSQLHSGGTTPVDSVGSESSRTPIHRRHADPAERTSVTAFSPDRTYAVVDPIGDSASGREEETNFFHKKFTHNAHFL
jgi:hypothetical protein